MKYCSSCGRVIEDSEVFCSKCGARQQPPTYSETQNGSTQYGSNNSYNSSYSSGDYYSRNNAFDSGSHGKSRGIAALLALFLGGLGIHYFYLDKSQAGLITILLTLCTCGAWEFILLAQAIYMLCIDNKTFEEKYIYSNSTLPLF